MSPRHRRDTLLDTGPLVALLDQADKYHADSVLVWQSEGARCITTEAVVTEASYMVARSGGDRALVLEVLLAGEVPIFSLDIEAHRTAVALLRRYHDIPMDYADATLVVAAQWLGTNRVFTLDRGGFSAYRHPNGARFSLLPER